MSLHPAVARCRRGVRRVLAGLEGEGPVLVASSGGADSLALLAAAVFEGHRAGRRVVGVCVDHGLQPDSAEHTARVVAQMAGLGADETVSARVTVSAEGLGPEAAARAARYDVLAEVARRFGAAVCLLGHTRDDQAETVLLGLTRGSGARSLQGMRRAFDGFARPLLDVTRGDTETACLVEGLEPWRDPHNEDDRFTRVRVRTEVMPVLERELGPGVAAALARTADQLRDDVAHLDALAAATYADLGGALTVAALENLPAAIRRRVLRLAALEAGALDADLAHEHVLALDELVTAFHGQRWIDLPGPLRALRQEGAIVFEPAAQH